jgi:TRAP-type C4-dicarboxylate transport system substrate-binding protein
MSRALVVSLLAALAPVSARAEPIVLRMATVAPPGSAWARLEVDFERDIEALTAGRVHMKWYLGGIAGDELEMAERIRREQLDGVASGGMLCMKLAPSMRVLRVLGLFQNRDESAYVSGRLKPLFDEEFARAGFVNLGEFGIGPDVLFSREPVRSLAELRKTRLWIWDIDAVLALELPLLGVPVVPLPITQANRSFERGSFDGFYAVPTGALAFQWSAGARYFADLRPSFLRGCLVVTSRAFDELPADGQRAMRAASAKLLARIEDLGRAQDEALLGGLFAKQGVQRIAVGDLFRMEFFEAARAARERLGDRLVPSELLGKVLALLADYRAEHRAESSR